jgi:predicted enzyme related to lactoylglutathione lyase
MPIELNERERTVLRYLVHDFIETATPIGSRYISKRHEDVLGLKATQVFEKDGLGMIEYDIASGTLAIGCGAALFKPSPDGGAIALEVEDFDAAIRRLKERNCKFHMDPYETPVCHMVVISDPDGNEIHVVEFDPKWVKKTKYKR